MANEKTNPWGIFFQNGGFDPLFSIKLELVLEKKKIVCEIEKILICPILYAQTLDKNMLIRFIETFKFAFY